MNSARKKEAKRLILEQKLTPKQAYEATRHVKSDKRKQKEEAV